MAKVTPSTLSLSGKPGEKLAGVVRITSAEGYPFSILEMSQKFKDRIQAELIPPEGKDGEWQVRVSVHSDKADDLYDIITLKTDSPYKPLLTIRVYAIYFDGATS